MAVEKQTLIELSGVSIGYNNHRLIENINLTIQKGEKILLLGSNGSGKTTLLKVIAKLKKPIAGNISYNYKILSYVPQSKKIHHFPISIQNTLRLYYPLFYPKQKQNQEIEAVLKQMNLWEKRNLLLSECSGGELQRVYLARALLRNPEILLLDEPLNAIDITSKQNFLSILEEMYQHLNCTIIMTSHDLSEKILNFFNKKLYIDHHTLNIIEGN
jgi:zinc transport system ATP-binding protein